MEWDEVIKACIEVLANELGEVKTADKLITKLSDENSKIPALVSCGKLKKAYLQAAKLPDKSISVSYVRLIRDQALKMDAKVEYDLCEKYLQLHQQHQQQRNN